MTTRRILLGLSAIAIVAGVAVMAFSLLGGGKHTPSSIPQSNTFVLPTPVPATPAPAPTLQPEPTPVPSDAAITRLVIPKIKVDTTVQVLGLSSDGAMQDPKGPKEVGWYDLSRSFEDFSSYPGWGGNAVFAGHVDYINSGPAVFYRLKELQPDDEIDIRLADGTQLTYRVTSMDSLTETPRGDLISAHTGAPITVPEIVGPVGREVVTLITCEGTFNTRTREYDKRLVVRADRVPAS